MYIDTTTGDYPLMADDIKARFPTTSFASPFYPPDGYAEVKQTSMPEWNPVIERCVEGAPENISGEWRRTWVIEKIYNTPEQEAAAIAESEAKSIQTWREQSTCTPFQGKAALFQAGLLDDVEALIADAATDTLTKLAWANAVEWKRVSPMITSLAVSLEMTDAQVDDLFRAAAQISA